MGGQPGSKLQSWGPGEEQDAQLPLGLQSFTGENWDETHIPILQARMDLAEDTGAFRKRRNNIWRAGCR